MLANIRIALLIGFGLLSFAVLYYAGSFVDSSPQAVYGEYRYVVDPAVAPQVHASSWGVFDLDTGAYVVKSDEGTVRPIASVTKLMTAHAILEHPDQFATAAVTWRAVATEGRAGKLEAGDVLQFREIIFPLLLESSNDAAEVAVDFAGGAYILESMNTHADELGMQNTEYRDSSGLSQENVSTVDDLRTFVLHVSRTHAHIFDVTRLTKYIGERHTWWNSNVIARQEGFLGGKNGFTDEAGRTLVALFEQSLQGGDMRRIGIILLDSDDLQEDVSSIREYLTSSVSYEYVLE